MKYSRQGRVVERLPGVEYCDAPDLKRYVFICGLHKSGTTLLEHTLVSALEFSCLRHSIHENEGQHAQNVYSPAYKFGGLGRFAFRSADMDRELASLGDFARHRSDLVNDWSPFVSGNFPDFIEKSPPNLTKINWLRQVFPGAKFIIMVRDPRIVSAATQKHSKTSLEELMRHWDAAYSIAQRDMNENDCMIVRFENLIKNQQLVIDSVSRFLNVPYRSEKIGLSARFSVLRNKDRDYIAMHEGRRYGGGVWNFFGY